MFEKIRLFLSPIWEFLAPFIRQMMTQAGLILMQVALEAVGQVEVSMTEADGAAKRANAFDLITDELRRKGIKLAASTINAAIEAAVLKLKS